MEQKSRGNKDLHSDCFVKARALVAALKTRHLYSLQKDNNIIGAAFGRRIAHGEITNEPAMVISVARKIGRAHV